MENVIIARPSLDEFGFEYLISQLSRVDIHSVDIEIDLRDVEFIDPYGMIGLLQTGRHFLEIVNRKILLHLPTSCGVIRYLQRMDFLEMAERFFIIPPDNSYLKGQFPSREPSDVLLELTKIEESDDVHTIVDSVKRRAKLILKTHLGYDEESVSNFLVALSEVCQNIPEHSQDAGVIAIQRYFYKRQLNKNVVKIAVMDLGIGMRESLKQKLSAIYGEDFSDLVAIEKALIEGISRYEDPGRGHGLVKVREFVNKWDGRISIRSQMAKFMILPTWAKGFSRQDYLCAFPGTQINIILPEKSFH